MQVGPTMSFTRVEAAVVLGALFVALGAGSLVTRTAAAGADREDAVEDARRVLRATEAWMGGSHGDGCPTLSTLQQDGELSRDARTDDPWGARFRVVCAAAGPSVRSYGRDGRPRTDDDIVVSQGS